MTIVITLSQHRTLGWLADPWLAESYREHSFQLAFRCASIAPANLPESLTVTQREIVSMARGCSEAEITRMFAPKGTTQAAFLKHPDEKVLHDHIRPFLDRKIVEMLTMSVRDDVPVFLRNEGRILTPAMRVEIIETLAEPWFCFTRTAEGSRYVLEIALDENTLDLREKEVRIITGDPCLIIHRNRVIGFPAGFDSKKLLPFLTREYVQIPLSAEKKYFSTFILKTLKSGQVKAEGFTVNELAPERSVELSLESDWQGNPLLVAWFRYGPWKIMAGKRQQVFTELRMDGEEYTFYRIRRDPAWEEAMIGKVGKTGLRLQNESSFILPDDTGIQAVELYRMVWWLSIHIHALHQIPVTIVQQGMNYFLGEISPVMRIIPGADWFDIEARIRFGDLEIPFRQLRRYILEGIREFPLPGGAIALLPEEWFTRYHDLFAFGQDTGSGLRLGKRHFPLLTTTGISLDAGVGESLRTFDPAGYPLAKTPENLGAILRSYQEEGLQWLQFLKGHGFGGCLADDMGLGKTIQALALLLGEAGRGNPASIIVMPASLVHNWRNEIARFAPSLRVMTHTGIQRTRNTSFFDGYDVILTTYGTCRNDITFLLNYRFHYAILDESQVIKNPDAQISRTVFSLVSDHRLVITGTPIENSLTDLWSQMEFLNPGLLGPLTGFKRIYVNGFEPAKHEEKVKRLRSLVAPFILRRRKSEVEPDLPDLTVEYRYCEMTPGQTEVYEKEKSAVRNELLTGIETGTIPTTSVQVLKALIRLRQTACHPKLTWRDYQGDSGKLDEVMRNLEILREEGQKVLVFSSFVEHLKIFEEMFRQHSWNYSMLTGSVVRREEEIERFREEGNNIFLISLKAGSTGLNLTEAGYVFMLDPWWNPAAEFQAINRAHRIGQDKKVIAYKFITKDSIEEKMLRLQERKQELSDALIPAGNPLKDLNQQQMAELLR